MAAKKLVGLTREQLLNYQAAPKEFIIKGYGSVFVRAISSGERLKLQDLYKEGSTDPLIPDKTVILGVCDPVRTAAVYRKRH